MRHELLFPQGRKKCCTFSFDDGQHFDRQLVSLFNKYNLKATFHLNSGRIGQLEPIEHTTWQELTSLYNGHEISCHGVTHPYFTQLDSQGIIDEILEDKRSLEKAVGYPIRGMSYPFGIYTDKVCEISRALGIEYSRTVESTGTFMIPEDFLKWHPTCHHRDVTDNLIDTFLNPPGYMRLELFYIWGHSFEFNSQEAWNRMEGICYKLANHQDVWYATNIEIKEYITAARNLVSSSDGDMVYNPSAVTVWLSYNDKTASVSAGETICF